MALSDEHKKEIQRLLTLAEGGELAASMKELVKYLWTHGWAYKQKVHCNHIGVRPENRAGLGLDPKHVASLVTSINGLGFVEGEAKGIALEIPATPRGDEVKSFNEKLIRDAEGRLGEGNINHIRFASLEGSHANQACRAVVYKALHDDPDVTVNGRLSMDKISPSWATSIRDGHEWIIVRAEVEAAFPSYAALQQSAGNSVQQSSKPEDDFQIAKKMAKAIEVHLKTHDGCQYSDIATEILRSRPPSTSSFPHIFAFVMKCGGGLSGGGQFLVESESYIRSHGTVSRPLPPEVWDALAAETKGSARIVWRHMILKLIFCAPERSITASDVTWRKLHKGI